MKRYEKFSKDPVALADYITKKLECAVKTIVEKTGNKFYYNSNEYAAVKGIVLTELMEEEEEIC